MKFIERGVLFLFLLAALIGVHGFIAAVMSSHNWEGMDSADWASWIGAVGTIGTLIGTIHIARSELQRRTAMELDLARVAAAEFWIKIPEALEVVDEIYSSYATYETDGFFYSDFGKKLAELDLWTTEDTVRLSPLPDHAAAKLSIARAEIRYCEKRFQTASDQWSDWSESARAEFDGDMRLRMEQILRCLGIGYSTCDRALLGTQVV